MKDCCIKQLDNIIKYAEKKDYKNYIYINEKIKNTEEYKKMYIPSCDIKEKKYKVSVIDENGTLKNILLDTTK
jgi:hypothetical protein